MALFTFSRIDQRNNHFLPIKQVYLYPLDRHFRQRCQAA